MSLCVRMYECVYVCVYDVYICVYMSVCVCVIGLVLARGSGDRGSVPGRVTPQTQKMVRDTTLFNTQYYKVLIKGKVEQTKKSTEHTKIFWYSSV